MTKSTSIIIGLLLVIIVILGWALFVRQAEAPSVPVSTTTLGETPDDTDTTPTPTVKPLHERVEVTYPKANASVPKKFTVTGKAPGNWFFEASAPVMVVDAEGNKLAQTTAQTIGDWMTTELVGFKAEISINPAFSGAATLVLMKDNPSGLPEHEDSLEIPIIVQ